LNTLFNCSKALKLQDLGFFGQTFSRERSGRNGRFSSAAQKKTGRFSSPRRGKSAAMAAAERETAVVEAGFAWRR